MEEQPIEVKPEEVKKVYKCISCGKSSDKGFFLLNVNEKIWEFEGDAMCLECYIRFMASKAIAEMLDKRFTAQLQSKSE
jgi:hypothetical protein